MSGAGSISTAAVAATQAQTRQVLSLEMVKQQANQDQAFVAMLEQTVQAMPQANGTGLSVNKTA